jgi:hypothetical protein
MVMVLYDTVPGTVGYWPLELNAAQSKRKAGKKEEEGRHQQKRAAAGAEIENRAGMNIIIERELRACKRGRDAQHKGSGLYYVRTILPVPDTSRLEQGTYPLLQVAGICLMQEVHNIRTPAGMFHYIFESSI